MDNGGMVFVGGRRPNWQQCKCSKWLTDRRHHKQTMQLLQVAKTEQANVQCCIRHMAKVHLFSPYAPLPSKIRDKRTHALEGR